MHVTFIILSLDSKGMNYTIMQGHCAFICIIKGGQQSPTFINFDECTTSGGNFN